MPDVMIMRGVPSMPSIPRNTRPGQYPYETVHVVKLLREQGLTVECEDTRDNREYLSHYAFDIWLPVMMIASGVTVNLVTEAIKKLVWGEKDAPKKTILHVELTIEDAAGDRRELEIDGPPDDVLDALNRLQREDGDGRQLPRDMSIYAPGWLPSGLGYLIRVGRVGSRGSGRRATPTSSQPTPSTPSSPPPNSSPPPSGDPLVRCDSRGLPAATSLRPANQINAAMCGHSGWARS